jgi:aminopeptidase N
MTNRAIFLFVFCTEAACGGLLEEGDADALEETGEADGRIDMEEEDAGPGEALEEEPSDATRRQDILNIALVVDMEALQGEASIDLIADSSGVATLEVGDLRIASVSGAGGPLDYSVADSRMSVTLPGGAVETQIVVNYTFAVHDGFEGYMAGGMTLTWPYYCGNLFPCVSQPAEGMTFELQLNNLPAGRTGVYPETIPFDAPAYQLAWAVGNYTYRSAGTTDAGTEVGYWFLPGGESRAQTGMENITAVVDWYEKTLGPYPFGDRAGAVEVAWPLGAYGGMEHHPYWHVAGMAMGDDAVHAHEACHGWFGDGVRIRCWEDFVLSEGTVTYMTARSLGQALGPAKETEIWQGYESELAGMVGGSNDGIAWPDSCGVVDIIEDGLFSRVPYIKGAYFYRSVADQVGADVLDGILGDFYAEYAGKAAGMQDMLDTIQSETGFDPSVLAQGWLRSLGRPDL